MISEKHRSSFSANVLYDFKREGKFADLVLVSWGLVEFEVDLAIRHYFGLRHDDPKIGYLQRNPFRRKVELLQELEYFSTKEAQAVLDFEVRRDKMFHTMFRGLFFDIQKEKPRNDIVDCALIAIQICQVASWRVSFPETKDKQPDPFVVWTKEPSPPSEPTVSK